ncbi:N-acetylneuraminate synthase family protein [Candidatus Woesearchaeota archaeon]|nr:N-acetylneuraminate synthase family protein [Candidatus Woesearchaeota archaeon]
MGQNIRIGDRNIGAGEPTLVIAETACAHDGSIEDAKKLVEIAVDGKADVVHFILFDTEDSHSPKHANFELAKKIEFSPDQWRELIHFAKDKGIMVATTVEDNSSLDLVSSLPIDILKIHTTDNTNPELIKKAAALGKPIMLSVGAMTFEEIENAVNLIKEEGNANLILMYGYQAYPTDPATINLRLIETLKSKFGLPVGYADHTDGASKLAVSVPLLAVALGADVIDKHMTLDRSQKGTDYEAALDPKDFKEFVGMVRVVDNALGDGIRHEFSDDEKKYRQIAKKRIVAARDLKKDTKITRKEVLFLRSDTLGLSPMELKKIEGKQLKKDLAAFDNIREDDVI